MARMRRNSSIVGCLCAAMLVTSCTDDLTPATERRTSPTARPLPSRAWNDPPSNVLRPPDYEGLGPPIKDGDFKAIEGRWGMADDSFSFKADGKFSLYQTGVGCEGGTTRHRRGYLVSMGCEDGTWRWWVMPPPRPGKGGRTALRVARYGLIPTPPSTAVPPVQFKNGEDKYGLTYRYKPEP